MSQGQKRKRGLDEDDLMAFKRDGSSGSNSSMDEELPKQICMDESAAGQAQIPAAVRKCLLEEFLTDVRSHLAPMFVTWFVVLHCLIRSPGLSFAVRAMSCISQSCSVSCRSEFVT